jgi:hypothetical protein
MRKVILALIVATAVLGAALIINLYRQPGQKLTIDSLPEGVSRHHIQGVSVFLARHGHQVDGFLDSTQHLPGEPLWWCPEEEVFVGPSHAELFNGDGQLIEGPATRDLDRIRVTVTAGGVMAVDPHIVQRGTVRAQRRLGPSGIPPEVWTAYRRWLDGNHPFCERHIGADPRG